MPVTVYGPVTPVSPNVRVTGVLSGAEVTILDNVTPSATQTRVNSGSCRTARPSFKHRTSESNPRQSSDPRSVPSIREKEDE
jgi:hypothetical protein